MDALLAWAPILWAGRVLAFLVVAAALVLMALLLARLLRPSAMRTIISGELPPLQSVKATLQVLGQRFEANAERDSKRDEQLLALERRIEVAEELLDEHGIVLENLLSDTRSEARHEEEH